VRAHLQPSKAGRVLCPLPCDPNPRHAQAKKEGDAEVVRRLEEVLKVAMAEKQKTLRPEIQLLPPARGRGQHGAQAGAGGRYGLHAGSGEYLQDMCMRHELHGPFTRALACTQGPVAPHALF